MRLSFQLPALATAVIAGLTLAATGPAIAGPAAAAASGTKLWEARYSASGRGAFGYASAVSPDGSTLFVTGGSGRKVREHGADAGTTVAYNAATGTTRWLASYNPGGLSTSDFSSIAVSRDGSKVFVAGGTQPAVDKPGRVVLVAYDAATGTAAWTDTPAITGPASSVAVSPDGSTVFITAGQVTAAYSAATGAARWTADLGAPAYTTGLAVSPDGSTVFLTGAIGTSAVVVAYNAATGTKRWSATVAKLAPRSLAVSPDGGAVFVTGLWGGSPGGATVYARTAALAAATGTTLWAKAAKSPNGGAYGNAVAVSPDSGTVFVTGSTTLASARGAAATWAYDAATGATRWLRTLRAPAAGTVITVSPDGSRVFAAGNASGDSGAEAFSAVAYDAATGAQLWLLGYRQAGEPWYSFALSIEASPDGSKVFVTGDVNTPSPGTIPTLAAVAYSS